MYCKFKNLLFLKKEFLNNNLMPVILVFFFPNYFLTPFRNILYQGKITTVPQNEFYFLLHFFLMTNEESTSVKTEIWSEKYIHTERLTCGKETAVLGRCICFQSFAKPQGMDKIIKCNHEVFLFCLWQRTLHLKLPMRRLGRRSPSDLPK